MQILNSGHPVWGASVDETPAAAPSAGIMAGHNEHSVGGSSLYVDDYLICHVGLDLLIHGVGQTCFQERRISPF